MHVARTHAAPPFDCGGFIMASSTLDPTNTPEPDRQLGKGHGTNTLGPSDTTDSGSDVQPGLHAVDEPGMGMGLERGTHEDSDVHNIGPSVGTDDSTRTGNSSTAGRNADVDLDQDINVDRIDDLSVENKTVEEAEQLSRSSRERGQPPQRAQPTQR
jgi:hypothetical protein